MKNSKNLDFATNCLRDNWDQNQRNHLDFKWSVRLFPKQMSWFLWLFMVEVLTLNSAKFLWQEGETDRGDEEFSEHMDWMFHCYFMKWWKILSKLKNRKESNRPAARLQVLKCAQRTWMCSVIQLRLQVYLSAVPSNFSTGLYWFLLVSLGLGWAGPEDSDWSVS